MPLSARLPWILLLTPIALAACARPESDPARDDSDLTASIGTFCNWPLASPDRKVLIVDECDAPGGARIVRVDVATGVSTTIANHRPQQLSIAGDSFTYVDTPDASHFVVHRVPFAGGPARSITFDGAPPMPSRTPGYIVSNDGSAFVGWRAVASTYRGHPSVRGEVLVGTFDGASPPTILDVPERLGVFGRPVALVRVGGFFDEATGSAFLVEVDLDQANISVHGPAFAVDPRAPSLRPITSWVAGGSIVDLHDGTLVERWVDQAKSEHVSLTNLAADTRKELFATSPGEYLSNVVRNGDELLYSVATYEHLQGATPMSIIAQHLGTGAERTIATFDPPYNRLESFRLTRSGASLGGILGRPGATGGMRRLVRVAIAGGPVSNLGDFGSIAINHESVPFDPAWVDPRTRRQQDYAVVGGPGGRGVLDFDTGLLASLPRTDVFTCESRFDAYTSLGDDVLVRCSGGDTAPYLFDPATGDYRAVEFPANASTESFYQALASDRWLRVARVNPAEKDETKMRYRVFIGA